MEMEVGHFRGGSASTGDFEFCFFILTAINRTMSHPTMIVFVSSSGREALLFSIRIKCFKAS